MSRPCRRPLGATATSIVIDGEKTWISNAGIASHYVVFCRWPEGGDRSFIALVVDAGTPGLAVTGTIDVIAPHPLGTLTFSGCRVPVGSGDRRAGQGHARRARHAGCVPHHGRRRRARIRPARASTRRWRTCANARAFGQAARGFPADAGAHRRHGDGHRRVGAARLSRGVDARPGRRARHARSGDGQARGHRVGAAGDRPGRAAARRPRRGPRRDRRAALPRDSRAAHLRRHDRDSEDRHRRARCSMRDAPRVSAHVDQFVRRAPAAGRPLAAHGLVGRAGARLPGSSQLRIGAARLTGSRAAPAIALRFITPTAPGPTAGSSKRRTASRTCSSRISASCPAIACCCVRPISPCSSRAGSPCSRPAALPCRRCRCCAFASSPRSCERANVSLALTDANIAARPRDGAGIAAGRARRALQHRGTRIARRADDRSAGDLRERADRRRRSGHHRVHLGHDRPGKGTVHFHRDILAVTDTYGRYVLRPHPDDIFIGSPPLAFTYALGGLVLFPMRFGASAALLEQAAPPQLLAGIDAYRATITVTSPTGYRAMLKQVRAVRSVELAQRRLGRRNTACGDVRRLARGDRCSPHGRHRVHRDAAHVHRLPARTRPIGLDRPRRPRLPRDRGRRRGERGAEQHRRPARGEGPDRVPLPGRPRQPAQVRPARLESHRRRVPGRRRRLLLVPGADGRHDHLVRLQHLRT